MAGVKAFVTDDYTLTYDVRKENGESYAIITGIKNISSYFRENGCLQIPSMVDGVKVRAVGDSAFANNRYIEEVEFSEGIKTINTNAFYNCEFLKCVTFPESLKVIQHSAFAFCRILKTINFAEGLEIIGPGAFQSVNVKEVNLPNSLNIIKAGAFRDSHLSSIHIGPNVMRLEASVFSGCEDLTAVTFSEGIRIIEDYVFRNCNALESISFPDSLLDLRYGVFDYCEMLKSIHLGPNVKIEDSTRDFAYGCSSLSKISVSPSNPYLKVINDCLYDMNNKYLIRVPPCAGNNVVTIPNWVKGVSGCCFDEVELDKLIVKSQNPGDLHNANISDINTVCCIPGSDVENWFSYYGFNIEPLVSEIDNFLNEITNNEKNI